MIKNVRCEKSKMCAAQRSRTESSSSSSGTSLASSYFDEEHVIQLEMFERKCQMMEAAYDKYGSMIKYLCSVMISQLTTMQKVVTLVAPNVVDFSEKRDTGSVEARTFDSNEFAHDPFSVV